MSFIPTGTGGGLQQSVQKQNENVDPNKPSPLGETSNIPAFNGATNNTIFGNGGTFSNSNNTQSLDFTPGQNNIQTGGTSFLSNTDQTNANLRGLFSSQNTATNVFSNSPATNTPGASFQVKPHSPQNTSTFTNAFQSSLPQNSSGNNNEQKSNPFGASMAQKVGQQPNLFNVPASQSTEQKPGFFGMPASQTMEQKPGLFGIPASQTMEQKPGLFGIPASQTMEQKPGLFGMPASQTMEQKPGLFGMPASQTMEQKPGLFGMPASQTMEQKPGLFGMPASQTMEQKPGLFGTPASQTMEQKPSLFGMPASQTMEQKPGLFGMPALQTMEQKPSLIGKPASQTTEQKPTGLFGTPAPQTAEWKPTNNFGPPSSQTTEQKPTNLFGAPAPQTTEQKPTNLFGAPASQTTEQKPTNLFGAPASQTTEQKPTNLFGAPAPQTTEQKPTNLFGAPAPQTTEQKPTNLFGAPAPQTTEQKPTNLFGTSAPQIPARFGATAPQAPNQKPSLFSVSATQGTEQKSSLFGSSPSQPSQNNTTQKSFLFGSLNTPKTETASLNTTNNEIQTTPKFAAESNLNAATQSGNSLSKDFTSNKLTQPGSNVTTSLKNKVTFGGTTFEARKMGTEPASIDGIRNLSNPSKGGEKNDQTLDSATAIKAQKVPSLKSGEDICNGLKGKTLDEIINGWNCQLDNCLNNFHLQAVQVMAWDKPIFENSYMIAKLCAKLKEAEELQKEIDDTLNYIDTQQSFMEEVLEIQQYDLTSTISNSENNIKNRVFSDEGRSRYLSLAEEVDSSLMDIHSQLKSLIEQFSSLQIGCVSRVNYSDLIDAAKSSDSDEKLQDTNSNVKSTVVALFSEQLHSLGWLHKFSMELKQKLDLISQEADNISVRLHQPSKE